MKVELLQVGDIIGETSLAFISSMIKWNTWGPRHILSQNCSSHIATVVESNDLFYLMEMKGKGINKADCHVYDHKSPLPHICWVGRHPAFTSEHLRDIYNEVMWDLHTRRVKYGFEDVADFVLRKFNIRLHDKEDTLICSELPKVGYAACGISYPAFWNIRVSPEDWQRWKDLADISKKVI